MKKILYTLAAAAILLTACNKDEGTPEVSDNVPVHFSTAITRAAGATWGDTDQIGVFMMNNGTALGVTNLADNVKLSTTDGTNFATASPIYYPAGSQAVDFVAYYPYRATPGSDPYIYKVVLGNQEFPQTFDLLYSNDATNKSRSTSAVGLTFVHKLSKVVLNIKKSEEVTTLSGLAVKITDMPTKANFRLADGGFETPTDVGNITPISITPASGYDDTYTAIVIPQAAGTMGRKLVFTIGTDVYEYAIPIADDFESAKNHPYNVTIKKTGIAVSRGAITDWAGINSSTDLGEGISIIPQTALIPKGTFLMGSSDGTNTGDVAGTGLNTTAAEPNRSGNETQHEVTLTKDFYMSKYAVTFAQYDAYCEATGKGKPSDSNWGRGDRPVINVNWNDAVVYCTWLSEQTGQTWRLPTEAEWEYACRGDYTNKATETATKPFGVGDGTKLYADIANFQGKYPYALPGGELGNYDGNGGYPNTYLSKTTPVGNYVANNYGLYDMHGNVWEWCNDWYSAYTTDAVIDPTGPATGSGRVLRGGSWGNDAQDCRSAYRLSSIPDNANRYIGFRVVLVP